MFIGVLGLGYVGLPLALAFGKKHHTIGYDISKKKIILFKKKIDPTGEHHEKDFKSANKLIFTNSINILKRCKVLIVAVPTPVDKSNNPDLSSLKDVCKKISEILKKGMIIVFEPTVYPGVTEDFCVPILEKYSNMKHYEDFNVGYSPERLNPGDKKNTLENVIKVVSADSPETLKIISKLYASIIKAGIFKACSIKVAEAAKVIENTQRDINIALMNELAMIFDKLNIDTNEVLKVASSKWNFLNFKPGLVGGHCIGVDPYYLTHKAEMLGHHPELILSGRKINDGMAFYIANKIIKKIVKLNLEVKKVKILILGITFKENCSDLRNSKVIDLVKELDDYGCKTFIYDPLIMAEHRSTYDLNFVNWDEVNDVDIIVGAVSHKVFLKMSIAEILKKFKKSGLFFDIKSSYPNKVIEDAGHYFWRL